MYETFVTPTILVNEIVSISKPGENSQSFSDTFDSIELSMTEDIVITKV